MIAQYDLEASKVLYRNRLYMESLFYFQQAVEKIVKSLGLVLNKISENDLRQGIGHNPIKIYDKIFQQIDITVQTFKEQIHRHPTMESNFASDMIQYDRNQIKIRKFFSELYRAKNESTKDLTPRQKTRVRYEFRKTTKEFNDIDADIRAFKRSKQYRKSIILEMEKTNYRMLRNLFAKLIPKEKLIGHEKEYRTLLKKSTKMFGKLASPLFSFELYYTMNVLFIMSLLTRDLATLSRYPTSKHDPITKYNKKNWMQENSFPIVEKAINKTKWIIGYIERKNRQNQKDIKKGPSTDKDPV